MQYTPYVREYLVLSSSVSFISGDNLKVSIHSSKSKSSRGQPVWQLRQQQGRPSRRTQSGKMLYELIAVVSSM